CRSRRSRNVARSEPSASISASSASIHSRVSNGSASGSWGSPTSRGIDGSMGLLAYPTDRTRESGRALGGLGAGLDPFHDEIELRERGDEGRSEQHMVAMLAVDSARVRALANPARATR